MLEVVHAQRIEDLLEAMIERVEQHARGPLDPIQLVVPSRTIETYLKLGLARSRGIAAQVIGDGWQRFLQRLAAAIDPRLWLLDRVALEGGLLGLLLDPERIADPELEAVAIYLSAAGD